MYQSVYPPIGAGHMGFARSGAAPAARTSPAPETGRPRPRCPDVPGPGDRTSPAPETGRPAHHGLHRALSPWSGAPS
ncbi:hypothetical protein GCM10010517_47080 [Streptosporangium fragile]|uniref:Uncharacterized protein n=1 Tax=Streptosporangium fragile TaxID=46186 RepID=A0ABN3W2C4_9ACTN